VSTSDWILGDVVIVRHSFHRKADQPNGQVLILFALASLVLTGFLALAVDVGYLLSERREVQNATDAAAMAGAIALLSGADNGVIRDHARAYAVSNGVSSTIADASSVDITGTASLGTVTVEIDTPVQKFFIGAIYGGDWSVSARAVAEVVRETPGEYALMALEHDGMYVNGNVSITVSNGGAFSNGDVGRSGGSNAFIVANTIDAVGNVNSNGNWSAPNGFHSKRGWLDDPLSGVQPPSPPSPVYDDPDDIENCNSDCTLYPGYYDSLGNINIKRTGIFEPGLYYFFNTSLSMQNTNSRIEGQGVMFYFDGDTDEAYFKPKNGEISLTAPANSPYANGLTGMTVWIANCTDFDSQGNGEFYFEGVFYAPCSRTWMHGNPYGESINGQVFVGSLDVQGTSDFLVVHNGYVDVKRPEVYLTE